MAPLHSIKQLQICRVSPPPGSVADTSLPLTFFDVIWLQLPPVQRLFFYQFPQNPNNTTTTTHFINTLLPRLKHSLSLSLRLFFPLAGNLTHSLETGDLEISYTDGDSVSLIIAKSDADFHRLVADYPRDVTEFHPLVPQLHVSDARKQPLLALQVTVFPNFGICIGITTHHGAADGSSSIHFMKSWASIYRSGEDSSIMPLPVHDRSLTAHLDGVKRVLLDQLAKIQLDRILETSSVKGRADPVRATFVMARADIEKLRRRVLAQRLEDSQKALPSSAYVLTCAYVWVCLVRARGDSDDARGKTVHFAFPTGYRAREDPPLPATYFGNCIAPRFVEANGSDFWSEDGVVPASEAIGREIPGLGSRVLEGAEGWIPRAFKWTGERVVTVAGSPKIRVYDTDFGWGKPKKVEIISIEGTGAISLAESRDEAGEIEVGLALPKCEMERFSSLFYEGLKVLA
ncbi:malonyl-coenzyme A:anthocyanin 3-O-glucoside-6''-O-malonyltransferase-like [Magnolia sinica]|uniref:malonyl-coenzyme A:anthocyanin 3-O-glucoside-6''-O-malonyltransferase-like n=1 Tax=Magnolia sinica TaxID=86752 RepID=UPI002659CAEE|nr:malonyl-coenzyme A:anthocyanin 3-O-glucoside-6''-O-malonyltransferase-like [Magnolia sinica]